jgi:F420-0:gamma-glutamyl ligase
MIGTVSRGIRCPVIKQGDDLRIIVAESVIAAANGEGFSLRDRDVVGVTESVVARSQGNYATVDDIAADVRAKFGGDTLGVIFPILSRNRFSVCLSGIARGVKKIILMLGYPSDEVGNHLFPADMLEEKNVNPWTELLTEAGYREKFGYEVHPFTGIDSVSYYKSIIEDAGCEAEVIFSNNAKDILKYAKNVLACDIHTRTRTVRALLRAGAEKALSLSDILTAPVNGSGFNEQYGLLGSNKATGESVKLFPRDCQSFVDGLQSILKERCGKQIEVMIYGDGAFKDPQGQIWELADPVVSPGYTAGLKGTPNEIKLKYIADNQFKDLSGKELQDAMKAYISQKDSHPADAMEAQGTTPRQLTDLIGSLCDLTSGSGDKGTPVILIQGYFDNYTTENS